MQAVTLSGRAPRAVVAVAEKTGKGGWCRRLAQVRGVRGQPGAGLRGLTVVVAVPRAERWPGDHGGTRAGRRR